ncbi:MAG TPA: T9SS type A sorting domain-containing protein, partial [Flavipsychrobacter sp.]
NLMKKLIFLPCFLFLYCFTSSAQRYADLEITLHAPVTGDTVWIGNQFTISSYIKNLGPDTIQFGDSLAFELLFDSSAISFGSQGGSFTPYLPLTGGVLAPGDSANMGFSFTLFQGWDTGVVEICVGVKHLNTVDTISDTLMANNRSCAMITIAEYVSVEELTNAADDISVYPNPARDRIILTSEGVDIERAELFNMQGQKVMSIQVAGSKADIDISQLVPGMYVLKINDSYIRRVMKE